MPQNVKSITIALAGQPNTGKSTLFNQLSGANQHVGNWPGKTVEQKTGRFVRQGMNFSLVDLPGTYSLSANSPEEEIARTHIIKQRPDVTVVVVDASQLSRTLYMALEVLALGVPTVVALNMMDVARLEGISINVDCLAKGLGAPVVAMTAARNDGVDDLLDLIIRGGVKAPARHVAQPAAPANSAIGPALEKLVPPDYSLEWVAQKLMEHDRSIIDLVKSRATPEQWKALEQTLPEANQEILNAAAVRYNSITSLVEQCVSGGRESRSRVRSLFDAAATHPVSGLVISFLIFIFWFMVVAGVIFAAFYALVPLAAEAGRLVQNHLSETMPVIASLLSQGVIPGVYMISILSLFVVLELLFIGFLEDVGYLPRLACVADPFMARIGLHGKALMPLFLGLGCNIAAIVGCRIIGSPRQRYKTLILSSHMPCQGLLAAMGFMIVLFFGPSAGVIAAVLAGAVLLQILITSRLLDHTVLRGKAEGMLIELPPYHRPNIKTIYRFMWLHVSGFVRRAGMLFVSITILIWALSYFPNGSVYDSYLASIGHCIEPVGKLMGMDWRLLTCLLVATFSKEASLIALAVMYQIQVGDTSIMGLLMERLTASDQTTNAQLGSFLIQEIPLRSAFAFLFAVLFSVPCGAAMGAIYSETRSLLWTFGSVAYYTALSLGWGILAYHVGSYIF